MTAGGAEPVPPHAITTPRPRLVLLASGNGSNAQAVIDACHAGRIDADVAAVVTNVPTAGVLARAHAAGIASRVVAVDGTPRTAYDARLAEVVAGLGADWVVLAGWMRLLTMAFLARFPGRVVNLHPALPGELPGTHAVERAFDEARAGHRTATGVMVHLVPDEGVDDGPVLATQVVPIHPGETLAELEQRVHGAEHALLVATLADLVAGRLRRAAPARVATATTS